MIQSIKIKIILIIFSAVVVIVSTSLVIEYSITSKLYQAQIEKEILTTVKLNVNKVDSYTQTMEQKADDLARAGEIFYKARQSDRSKNIDSAVEEYLVGNFLLFPTAVGGGVWYEPYKVYPDQKYYGPYVFWEKGNVSFTWDLNTPEYDYLTQDWYTTAIPLNWDKTQKREHKNYWTPPYFDDAGTFLLMITVDSFMYDKDGSIIGISTVDWALENMLTFLKSSKITEDTETFLIEKNSNIVMANTLNPESAMKSASSVAWVSLLDNPQRDVIKTKTININDIEYYAYYTLTDAGMFYGTLIPSKVIFEQISKLLTISIIGSISLTLLLILVLYLALSTVTSSIISLTGAVSRVAVGDLTTRIKITSKDEIGLLGAGFNQMVGTLSTQKQELENRASNLEATVAERTKELKDKLDELEKLNRFMVGRELQMTSLKEEIKVLEKKLAEHIDDSKE